MINGTIGIEFDLMVYNHEWISFCSSSVHLKGQRSHKSLENHLVACISVIKGTVGMEFGILVYNREWISSCLSKRSRSQVNSHSRKSAK